MALPSVSRLILRLSSRTPRAHTFGFFQCLNVERKSVAINNEILFTRQHVRACGLLQDVFNNPQEENESEWKTKL